MDRSVAMHPDTKEIIELIFLGENELLTDMSHLNIRLTSVHQISTSLLYLINS